MSGPNDNRVPDRVDPHPRDAEFGELRDPKRPSPANGSGVPSRDPRAALPEGAGLSFSRLNLDDEEPLDPSCYSLEDSGTIPALVDPGSESSSDHPIFGGLDFLSDDDNDPANASNRSSNPVANSLFDQSESNEISISSGGSFASPLAQLDVNRDNSRVAPTSSSNTIEPDQAGATPSEKFNGGLGGSELGSPSSEWSNLADLRSATDDVSVSSTGDSLFDDSESREVSGHLRPYERAAGSDDSQSVSMSDLPSQVGTATDPLHTVTPSNFASDDSSSWPPESIGPLEVDPSSGSSAVFTIDELAGEAVSRELERLQSLGESKSIAPKGKKGPLPRGRFEEPPRRSNDATVSQRDDLKESLPNKGKKEKFPKIPGYEILDKLGDGGMGVVYLARQKGLGRMVALKMIRGSASEDAMQRFVLEARAVAKIRHPNIVQIYEIGEVDHVPYFSLELLEGGNFTQKLANTPQDPRQSARWVKTLAEAMYEAHSKNVIHRDLKPANVMLAGDGTLKITDFGLAKELEKEQAEGNTVSGQIMGTPSYMSPEQASGKVEELGPLTDLYALGAILYEMLTGRPPFKGTSAMATVFSVIHEEPVAPSKLVPRLPRDIETICLKCLEKDPAKRYSDCRALAEDLQNFLDGRPIKARRASLLEQTYKWARRNPYAAVSVGLVTCLIVGGVSAAFYVQKLRADQALENQRREQEQLAAKQRADNQRREQRIAEQQKLFSMLVDLDKEAQLKFDELQRMFQVDEPDYVAVRNEAIRFLDNFPAQARQMVRASPLGDDLTDGIRKQQQEIDELGERVQTIRQEAERQLALTKRRNELIAQVDQFLAQRDRVVYLATMFDGLTLQSDPDAFGNATLANLNNPLVTATDREVDGITYTVWQLKSRPEELPEGKWTQLQDAFDEALLLRAEALAREDNPLQAARAAWLFLNDPQVAKRLDPFLFYHERLAELAKRLGDSSAQAQAEQRIEELSRQPLKKPIDHFALGLRAYFKGDWSQAEASFAEALSANPGTYGFWSRVLRVICIAQSQDSRSYSKNRLETAISELVNLIQNRPNPEPWLWILLGYIQAADAALYIEAYERLPDSRTKLGALVSTRINEARNSLEEARLLLEPLIADKDPATLPSNLREMIYALKVNLGIVDVHAGKFARVQSRITQAQGDPTRAAAFQDQALAHLNTARARLQEANQLDQRQYQSHALLSKVLVDLDEPIEALRELDQAILCHQTMLENRIRHQRDDTPANLFASEEFQIKDSRLAKLHRSKAQIVIELARREQSLSTTRWDEAVEALTQAIERNTDQYERAEDLANRAQFRLRAFELNDGRPPEPELALADAQHASELDPRLAIAQYWQIVALMELERYDEVLEASQSYIELIGQGGLQTLGDRRALGNLAAVRQLRGICFLRKPRRNPSADSEATTNFVQAIDEFTLSLELQPDSAPVLLSRGLAHLALNSHKLALKDFDAVLEVIRRPRDNSSPSAPPRPLSSLNDAERRLVLTALSARARTRVAEAARERDPERFLRTALDDLELAMSLAGPGDLADLKVESGLILAELANRLKTSFSDDPQRLKRQLNEFTSLRNRAFTLINQGLQTADQTKRVALARKLDAQKSLIDALR